MSFNFLNNLMQYIVGPPYPWVLHPWIQRANCTTSFYIRNLSILRFWYLRGFWNQFPTDTGKWLCSYSLPLTEEETETYIK